MALRRLVLAALAAVGLAACQASDPQPISFVLGDEYSYCGGSCVIAGGGASELVAYTRWDGTALTLRVLRHRAEQPDRVELVTELDLGGLYAYYPRHLAVGGSLVAIDQGASVAVLDVDHLDAEPAVIPLNDAPDVLAIEGRWLLAATGSALTLASVDDPAAATTFAARAPVTSALGTRGRFLAFTTAGYVHVAPDATAPAFTAIDDATLRNFGAAFADGTEAVAAGPAPALGRARVVRLDLASPAAPKVLRGTEVDGYYGAFAWDGAGMGIVGEKGESWVSPVQGRVVREQDGAFTVHGIPLPDDQAIAAHAGRLFALAGQSGLGMYAVR